MKISICIPQYNRIDYLKVNLQQISHQKDVNVEVIISDDASTDNTQDEVNAIKKKYPFPIVYFRFETNQGYDRNLRKTMELATGDYCFILGNDDTLAHDFALSNLLKFIKENDFPSVGFCNVADYTQPYLEQIRAQKTTCIGTGVKIALKYYSSFSFVAGLIFKKQAFDEVNTAKFDKSIYIQIYLAILIILKGGKLFTLKEILVLKDITINNEIANSYLDTLPRDKNDYKELDAGLPSYAYVCAIAFYDAGIKNKNYYYKIIKRIYCFTYPFWLFDYRKNGARVAALGLKKGLELENFKDVKLLSNTSRVKLKIYYTISSLLGLYVPTSFFYILKKQLYRIAKS